MNILSRILKAGCRIEIFPYFEKREWSTSVYKIRITNERKDTYIYCSMSDESVKGKLEDKMILDTLTDMFRKLELDP